MAETWQGLMDAYSSYKLRNDLPNAIKFLRGAIAANPPIADAALMFNSLASVLVQVGDLSAAESAARSSVALQLENNDQGDSSRLAAYNYMLAEILASQSRFEEALPFAENAVEFYSISMNQDDDFLQQVRAKRDLISEKRWRG